MVSGRSAFEFLLCPRGVSVHAPRLMSGCPPLRRLGLARERLTTHPRRPAGFVNLSRGYDSGQVFGFGFPLRIANRKSQIANAMGVHYV